MSPSLAGDAVVTIMYPDGIVSVKVLYFKKANMPSSCEASAERLVKMLFACSKLALDKGIFHNLKACFFFPPPKESLY